MNARNRALLDALLRHDLAAFTQRCFQTVVPGQQFLPNWHVEAIAHELERCRRHEIRRLIITLPPRNLKSICASVAFPAFALGHDPTLRIVCASYSQDLTAKHARDCRTVMESGPGTGASSRAPGSTPASTPRGSSRPPPAAIGSPHRWAAPSPAEAAASS